MGMSSRSQAIADILTRAIIEHRLVPGCKLGERELAEMVAKYASHYGVALELDNNVDQ